MRRKKEKTKKALRMGTGEGAAYKPYIQVGEFGSEGTAAKVVDWKHGRTVHLLSQGEVMAYYLLRWDDNNLDIREQYPLDKDTTIALSEKFGIQHPSIKGEPVTMTTDFLVTREDGEHAISIKVSEENVRNNPRVARHLFLEKNYWEDQGIDYNILTKEEMDYQKYLNIRDCVAHYNDKHYTDDISLLKQLIAHKKIVVDMSQKLDYEKLIQTEEFKKWLK